MNDLTFGNEFTDTNDDRWRYLGTVAGGRYAFFSLEDTDTFDTDGVLKIKDISGFKLTGITAECLAELARGNYERKTVEEIEVSFYGNYLTVYLDTESGDINTMEFVKEEKELLPQFFLRVVKERNYLK